MESITWQPHVLYGHRFIQSRQDAGNLVDLRCRKFSAIIVFKELCQPLVFEILNHQVILRVSGGAVKYSLTSLRGSREGGRASAKDSCVWREMAPEGVASAGGVGLQDLTPNLPRIPGRPAEGRNGARLLTFHLARGGRRTQRTKVRAAHLCHV